MNTTARPQNAFVDEPAVAAASFRVAVLGCGSVGSAIAWCCASTGIRQIALADRDHLEPGNLRRHLGGRADLGRPKVAIVADFLSQRFTQVEAFTLAFDFLEEPDRLRTVISSCDLVYVAVDAEGPKHLIDGMARELGKPAVYAGLYGGGWAGEVILTDPTQDSPCYACCARGLGRVGIPVDAPAFADYAMPSLVLSPTEWARADLTSILPIAALATRIGFARLAATTHPRLLQEWRTGCAWRLSLREVPAWGSTPWQLLPVHVERDPECFNCSSRDENGSELERFAAS